MRETLRVLQATETTNIVTAPSRSARNTPCTAGNRDHKRCSLIDTGFLQADWTYCDVTHLFDGYARAIDSGVAVVDDDGVDDDALARHEAAPVDAEVSSDEARVEAAAGDT